MRRLFSRVSRFKRLPLGLEISLALLLKIVLLCLVWKFFFSAPQAKKMLVPMPHVEQHLLGRSHTASPTSRSKDSHDSAR
ncbi:MAG: cytochrome oxidase putative small subunit CydP [Pseudomonadota bacterium]